MTVGRTFLAADMSDRSPYNVQFNLSGTALVPLPTPGTPTPISFTGYRIYSSGSIQHMLNTVPPALGTAASGTGVLASTWTQGNVAQGSVADVRVIPIGLGTAIGLRVPSGTALVLLELFGE